MHIKEKKLLAVLIVVLLLIDQVLKIIFLVNNLKFGNIDGVNLGILEKKQSENNLSFILVSFIAIFAILRYMKSNNTYVKTSNRIVLAFALAGTISNFIDIIWNKGTINYINIQKSISINLGHLYFIITWIGMAVLLTKHTSNLIKERKNV